MKWSQRPTNFRRSNLYRELKRQGGFRAICIFENLVDTICEIHKPADGAAFILTMPEQDWLAEVDLHHHAKATLQLVLEIASSHGAVVYELLGSKISISLPHLLEIADFWTKKKLREYGVGTAYKENIEEEKERLSSSDSDEQSICRFVDSVKALVSKHANEQFAKLPPMIERHFEKIGEKIDLLDEVVALIEKQFAGNDRQKQIGEQIVAQVKDAYARAIKSRSTDKVVLSETSSAREMRVLQERSMRMGAVSRLTASKEALPSKLKRKRPVEHLNGEAK